MTLSLLLATFLLATPLSAASPADAQLRQAWAFERQRNLSAAAKAYADALALDPEHEVALKRAAIVTYQLRDYQASLKHVRQFLNVYDDPRFETFRDQLIVLRDKAKVDSKKRALAAKRQRRWFNDNYFSLDGGIYMLAGINDLALYKPDILTADPGGMAPALGFSLGAYVWGPIKAAVRVSAGPGRHREVKTYTGGTQVTTYGNSQYQLLLGYGHRLGPRWRLSGSGALIMDQLEIRQDGSGKLPARAPIIHGSYFNNGLAIEGGVEWLYGEHGALGLDLGYQMLKHSIPALPDLGIDDSAPYLRMSWARHW